MIKFFINFFLYIFILLSLNSCSTISETVDLAGIVDKTEDLFFGKDDKDEEKEQNDISEEKLNEETILEEEIPDITDIPTEPPEFSDIEKDFFEGEKDFEILEYKEDQEVAIEEKTVENSTEITLEEKNLQTIYRIPVNIRARVRMLMYNSDPPTRNNGKTISYQSEDSLTDSYKEDDKIAVFYFPNNSVLPDSKAQSVINEIVNIYNDNLLVLVGHASSLGGDSPKGKKINMNLSFARAEAIKNMLTNKGFPSDSITVLAKGDLEPVIKPNGKSIESENRRVEVFLLSK
tara:strand:+ start:403 stop:1272 length:870 start_codon:yes stop_codon:yes gene_type:complete